MRVRRARANDFEAVARLLEELGLARERGCWQLTLESGYPRKEAHVMYEALGMSNAGYYFSKPLA